MTFVAILYTRVPVPQFDAVPDTPRGRVTREVQGVVALQHAISIVHNTGLRDRPPSRKVQRGRRGRVQLNCRRAAACVCRVAGAGDVALRRIDVGRRAREAGAAVALVAVLDAAEDVFARGAVCEANERRVGDDIGDLVVCEDVGAAVLRAGADLRPAAWEGGGSGRRGRGRGRGRRGRG